MASPVALIVTAVVDENRIDDFLKAIEIGMLQV
jgi:hypothetical protein